MRDLNLVDSLLAELAKTESIQDEPDTLAQLYRLDHLATRLRRNTENLRVLSGRDAGTTTEDTASLVDVIRAGMSSIERYTRINIGRVAPLAVVGFAADDVGRLLAELLDNATAASPPTSPVTVSAHVTEQGSVLTHRDWLEGLECDVRLPALRSAGPQQLVFEHLGHRQPGPADLGVPRQAEVDQGMTMNPSEVGRAAQGETPAARAAQGHRLAVSGSQSQADEPAS